ncbi:hypothetical protein [Pseudomonas sp. IT-P395]|uniref:hypothetical protein n=1 Tax=Pseudomonas sp. IT-P395 TaxID=3026459 RepID=UPI0039DF4F66
MEFIVDLHGTSETKEDAKAKAVKLLKKPGSLVKISDVVLNPSKHSATVTYELEPDPDYVPPKRGMF